MASASMSQPVVDVVLYAEFDIDKGSTLRESYPQALAHYSPEFFADVMLPEGVHNRQQDFTIFFLNRDSKTTEEATDAEKDPLKEFMYCLSVVRTHHDATVRRGARVKAVALCSRQKFCFAFKNVLEVAVSKLAVAKDEAETKQVVQELYEVVNAVDSGNVRDMSDMERRLMKARIDTNSAASLVEQKAQEEALFHHSTATWGDQKIPVRYKLCSTEDQFDDGLLRKLLLKFGEQSMILYNAVLTGQRVLVLGYNQPAGDVCNYVLAMSSLVCPPLNGLIQRQFPYANLTDLSFLSTPGYIAGVTNPMFKSKRDWWDVLCDISSGEVVLSVAGERDEYEAADRAFVQEVLDGIHAGYSEEWVRCQFEEYTLQNVVDIALGESNYMDAEMLARRTASNNRRITKWARTDNYKAFMEARQKHKSHTDAFNISFSRYVCAVS
ncbi:hypothetical protein Poli38472_003210 [Pythium oligandrum]|uniref:UDENN domain-containing protein n=1 Tax=Pythium oligandrum TaxID=41045 RepID=A0A8K1FBH6_PYTOL|nr:hypothetical protein Poli38472_003210 [Pythium oligandrum]|eukprot:TMW57285.1 hypothetical protein Poli38472_003210 [Pythium oligandrum]